MMLVTMMMMMLLAMMLLMLLMLVPRWYVDMGGNDEDVDGNEHDRRCPADDDVDVGWTDDGGVDGNDDVTNVTST